MHLNNLPGSQWSENVLNNKIELGSPISFYLPCNLCENLCDRQPLLSATVCFSHLGIFRKPTKGIRLSMGFI